jgi:RND superfamily putative drug exporter
MLSGLTFAVGLLVLVVIPVPLVRSIGFGGMLIPAVSVAVALTLLPVLLATGGQRSPHQFGGADTARPDRAGPRRISPRGPLLA